MPETNGGQPERQERYLDRPLPHDAECEQVILGNILIDNAQILPCVENLRPDHFYSPLNRRVYSAMLTLFNESRPIDPITVGDVLNREGSLSAIGGVSTITNLTRGIPHQVNLSEYIRILIEKTVSRNVMRLTTRILDIAHSEEYRGDDLLEYCEQALFDLRQNPNRYEFTTTQELSCESTERVRLIAESGQRTIGLSTGFTDLDERTLGLHRSELSILAARPSMGKTALALNIAQNAAYRLSATVAFFSLEMSKEQLIERIICSECGIDSHRYRTGMLNEEAWERINAFQQCIADSHLYIDDAPAITIPYMRAKLRRLFSQRRQLDLVLVDYLQLMTGQADSREREIAQISRDLKTIAKEFDVPILATAQLNRAPEQRSNHRPSLSDLRESGQIEQDADTVYGLYRDDYYNQEPSTYTNIGELIILKQRNGPTGAINLQYNAETSTFRNLAPMAF